MRTNRSCHLWKGGSAGSCAVARSGGVWVWVRRVGLTAVAIAVIEYLAVPRIIEATSNLTLLVDATLPLLAAAVLLEVGSLAAYTALSRALASRPGRLGYFRQVRIDLTGLGVSHIVPGGGASAAALRLRLMGEWGVSPAEAAAIAAVQTALVLVALVAVAAWGVILAGPGIWGDPAYAGFGALAAILLAAAVLGMWTMATHTYAEAGKRSHSGRLWALAGRVRQSAPTSVRRAVGKGLEAARTTRRRVVLVARDARGRWVVLGWAAAFVLLDLASLGACLRAYGLDLPTGALLVAYGAANLAGLLPITPGGLGVVEGVLIPTLTALGGMPAAGATLGVLTWRLIGFWLPIPVSGVTYVSLEIQSAARRRAAASGRKAP